MLTTFVLIGSCGSYELTVNEKTVYDPLEFRRDLVLDDAGLEQCVKIVLTESRITAAPQLKQLSCGPGEIASLSGLEVFRRLESLGLADNKIENLSAIAHLPKLRQLSLANNQIIDVRSLYELKNLVFLDLRGNPDLNCQLLRPLMDKKNLELQRPKHCLPEM